MRRFRIKVIGDEVYTLPPRLMRSSSANGWIVCFTKQGQSFQRYFSDSHYTEGTRGAFRAAMKYLTDEGFPTIYALPTLRESHAASNFSQLPVGVYGPYWVFRKNSHYCVLMVSTPTIEGPSRSHTFYIGTMSTWEQRFDDILARATELRERAVALYEEAAEELRRVAAAGLDNEDLVYVTTRASKSKDKKIVYFDFKHPRLPREQGSKAG